MFTRIIFSFPAPILLALMINEVGSKGLKKTIQTISYIPHFISLVVVCGMLREFCASDGLFNSVRALLGQERYNLLTDPSLYRTIHIGSGIWQSVGWSSIIYLATLSGVDTQLYEAAYIDGAQISGVARYAAGAGADYHRAVHHARGPYHELGL